MSKRRGNRQRPVSDVESNPEDTVLNANLHIGGGLTVGLVVTVIGIVLLVGLVLGILIYIAHDSGHSRDDDDDDDHRRSDWTYAFQLDSRQLDRLASELKGSNWTGNTIVLTESAKFREDVNVSFLERDTGTAYGFYVLSSWRAFNPDGSIFDEGTEDFACFLGVDGVVYCSELRPDQASFANLQLLRNDSLQFRILESSDRTLSLALSGILKRKH